MTATTLEAPDVPVVVEVDDGAAWWIFADRTAAIQHIREARAEGHRASIAHPVDEYRRRFSL